MTAIAPPVAGVHHVGARADRRRQGWVRRAPLLPALVFTIIITQLPFLVTLYYSPGTSSGSATTSMCSRIASSGPPR